jgi:hypothetical protein
MNKKQKHFIFFMLTFIILASANFAFALEINYPNFIGAKPITANSELPDLIRYFFAVGIAFSGAIALISLAIAGVQLIIGQANPEGVSNAKDRIKGSLLGLALLMVSFLIIQSINPVLIEPTISPLSSAPGIFFVNNNKQSTCPQSVSDASLVPSDFIGGDIEYRCANPSEPNLLIWEYAEKNFKMPIFTHELLCNKKKSIPKGSFKIAFKTPGAYFYETTECIGYRSNVVLTSGQIPEEFKKGNPEHLTPRCIEFVNDPTNKTYYGAILHEKIDESQGGMCQAPLVNSTDAISKDIITINNVSSITIFTINTNQISSGDGIEFYSGQYGWDVGNKPGIYKEFATTFVGKNYLFLEPKEIIFDFFGSSWSLQEQQAGRDFSKPAGQGSIRILGNYLVALYNNPLLPSGYAQDGYCQVFKKSIVDMKGTEYIGAGNILKMIYLIPTK